MEGNTASHPSAPLTRNAMSADRRHAVGTTREMREWRGNFSDCGALRYEGYTVRNMALIWTLPRFLAWRICWLVMMVSILDDDAPVLRDSAVPSGLFTGMFRNIDAILICYIVAGGGMD